MSLASILRSPTPSLRSERRTKSARFALRLLGLAILLASLILNTVATQTFYYHPAYLLTSSAFLPLSLSLLWHLLDLHAMRSGRPLRIWILGIVESLLTAAFLALFVVGMVMIRRPHFWYGLETVERTVLMTWDAGLWLVLGVVHAVVVGQCLLRVWKRKRRRCSECMREKRQERWEGRKGTKEERGQLGDDHKDSRKEHQRITEEDWHLRN